MLFHGPRLVAEATWDWDVMEKRCNIARAVAVWFHAIHARMAASWYSRNLCYVASSGLALAVHLGSLEAILSRNAAQKEVQ